ncbi:MAG: hypothetical protein KC777_20410 [Cyanobacteria bacterium HKST-UBA02]|nr:hypothetical protein [Cyanobacteria bacterium HKST-UBA02]
MDVTAAAMSTHIDQIVIFCFGILVVLLVLMAFPLLRLLEQSTKTLGATENFINTLDKELGPTIKEVDNVLVTVQEFRAIAEKGLTGVGTKVEDVTGSITKVADSAKTETSVWGVGVMAGLKAYFTPREEKSSAEKA